MRFRRSVVLVVLAMAMAIACKKQEAGDPGNQAEALGKLPASLMPSPSAVDVDKLVAPALLGYVPADTPYVATVFEPLSTAYFEKLKTMYGPMLDRLIAIAPRGDSFEDRLVTAIMEEMKGKWNAPGMASLGINPRAHWVIYGLGVAPVVVRMELSDGEQLVATIERIAKRTGATLPARETQHGKQLWRVQVPEDSELIIAIDGNQLVLAIGPRDRIAATLPLILGAERPSASMADGKQLKQLIAKHQLGPQMVGFVDVKRVVSGGIELSGATPPAACLAESDRITGLAPRAVFGADITERLMSATMLVELAPSVVDRLKRVKVAVPGFAEAFDSKPLLALGTGARFGEGKAALQALLGSIQDIAKACGSETIEGEMRSGVEALSGSRPEVEAIRGGYAALQTYVFPMKIDGYGLLATSDPKQLFDKLQGAEAKLRALGVPTDGKLHPVKLPDAPIELHASVGGPGIMFALGSGKAGAERALAATHGDHAPLFAMMVDYGRLLEIARQFAPQANGLNAEDMEVLIAAMKTLGPIAMAIDVTDHGLAWWYRFELK